MIIVFTRLFYNLFSKKSIGFVNIFSFLSKKFVFLCIIMQLFVHKRFIDIIDKHKSFRSKDEKLLS